MKWMPLYWLGKYIFILYLYHPQFRGAEQLYIKLVEPAIIFLESYATEQVRASQAKDHHVDTGE